MGSAPAESTTSLDPALPSDDLARRSGTVRLASSPHLPYRFRVPAGWPSPSPDWLAANQGWEPPVGWVPVVGAPSAPEAWVFWERHPEAWLRFTEPHRRQAVRGLALGWVVLLAGLVLLAGRHGAHGPLDVVAWGAVLFGPIELARNAGELLGRSARALARARATSARLGAELDASAAIELGAHDPAAFIAARVAEAWSHDDGWPASQRHEVPFTVGETTNGRGRRLGLLALAGATAVVLVFVLAWSAESRQSTSVIVTSMLPRVALEYGQTV